MTAPGDSGPSGSAPLLLGALRRALRPLVRLLVAQQIAYPSLAGLLKSLYVEVADSEFRLEGRRETLSRVTLLTGIHRREVKRLREGMKDDDAVPRAIALGSQILSRWTHESDWLDRKGKPRVLARSTGDGDGASFDDLVRSVSVDIHPRSVLDEWLRLGIVELDAQDHVTLVTGAFVPTHGFEEKAHFVGRNLRDHIAAAAENLESDPSPFLERSVHYASLPANAIAALDSLAREVGQSALEQVDEAARAARDAAAPSDGRRRMTFGVYFYETVSRDPAPPVGLEDDDE
jgi:hypothetical protein